MNVLNVQTAIIGAGISGISAAINFLKNDYENFVLFEASDRIGGRCHTFKHGDGILEYGAQFIHGQVNNPIYKIAIKNGLIDKCYSKILDEDDTNLNQNNSLFLNQNGEKIDSNLINVAYKCLNKSIDLAEKHSLDITIDKDLQLGFFIYENYLKLIRNHVNLNNIKVKTNVDSIFLWRCKWENVENSCSSVFDLSLKNFSNFVELNGSQIMEPKKGYSSIIETIIRDHKEKFENNLKLNHQLIKILLCETLDDSSQTCEHCNYTKDREKVVLLFTQSVVICERVILTVSLGYLKENIKSLITPLRFVSDKKLSSIERLGFGTVNKVILEYDCRFWSENLESLNIIWSDMDKEGLFDRINHVNFDYAERWFEDMCSFEPALGHDNILIGWIGGNYFHESLSDEEVIAECTRNFKKIFKRDDIPKPKNVFRSKWHSNKLFNGSYSFFAFGTQPTDMEDLAEPIEFERGPVIQFAGEATHSKFYSTVHGAFLTGIRESNRILKLNQFFK